MTNPNGANQYTSDPRQLTFLSFYLDPKSETWSNALQSALKAGYTQEYAENLMSTMPKWLSESLGDSAITTKALTNLSEALDGYLDKEDAPKNIQWKATELALKGLQKGKWSERHEHTGKDGEKLQIVFDNSFNKDEPAR